MKWVSLTACMLLPATASANWQPGWLDNWLLGLSGGYATRKSDIDSRITTFPLVVTNVRDSSDNGWLAAGFGGYQAMLDKWLLGGEFNLEWQEIEDSHNYAFAGRNVNAEYRRKGSIALTGRIGYALTPNLLPYIRVGAEVSRDSLTSTFVGPPTSASIFNKAWIHRFIVGVGAEMPIPCTCGISLRLEYDYHSKGQTIEDYGSTGSGITTIEYYTAMQPRTYSGRLSVVWNFLNS